MMVVLILAITMSVVFAKIDYLSPKYTLRAAARQLARVVALARSQAAATGRIHFIKYKLDDKRYYILAPFVDEEAQARAAAEKNQPSSAPPIPHLRWEPVLRQELPAGVFFRDIVIGGTQKIDEREVNVEISPFGITKGHIVHLTDGKNDYSLEINPLTGMASFHEEYLEPPPIEEDASK